MSILHPSLEGARVLDLFSGSGALGLEALSRGASHCTFVEKSRGALRILTRNIEQLGASETSDVVSGDAMAFVRRPHAPYDVALADPPYDKGLAAALIEQYAVAPFAYAFWVEHRKGEEISGGRVLSQRDYGDTTLTGVFHDFDEDTQP